ncbi:MAG: YdcH family protein [Rhodospirillales bacterium]|nr:YdcH family protein [Rhodospirillales bacterium]
MSLEQRIKALKERHKALDAALEEEFSRPHPDDLEIHSLKKRKLQIKDEIASISTR